MFRPPRSVSDLPDELLLHIGAQFTHLDRNADLTNLALVSRRWRPIAQEWLLKCPRFNLTYIDQYMWEIGHRPRLLAQVRSLEIWSTSEARVRRDERGMSVKEYKPVKAPFGLLMRREMMEKCAVIITHFAHKKKEKDEWLDALRNDVVPALFGVLLCILPNLKDLKLGNAWLMDFPFFSTMLASYPGMQFMMPAAWEHSFLAGALTPLLSRLDCLEVPADMVSMYVHSRTTRIFDFRRFVRLKELGVTMRVLSGFGMGRYTPPNPSSIFPASLEVLRISEASELTAGFLDNVCRAKKAGNFLGLRRIEVYHAEGIEWTKTSAELNMTPDPVEDVRVMFKDAGLELYLYFPSWRLRTWKVGGTPWRLNMERGRLRCAEMVRCRESMIFGAVDAFFSTVGLEQVFEAEWDRDGDAVMV
ncbi:Nn.00g107520.m01.CDS01 [Neocucurbitaria sp. VM-36]